MLYSMNDPVEGDDEELEGAPDNEQAEGETQTETRTVTRHKASGKFVKAPKKGAKPTAAELRARSAASKTAGDRQAASSFTAHRVHRDDLAGTLRNEAMDSWQRANAQADSATDVVTHKPFGTAAARRGKK